MNIRQWISERATTVRGLRADLARMNTDLETLGEHCQRLGGRAHTLAEDCAALRTTRDQLVAERAMLRIQLKLERRSRERVEADLASLRDKLVEFRDGGIDHTTRGDHAVKAESAA